MKKIGCILFMTSILVGCLAEQDHDSIITSGFTFTAVTESAVDVRTSLVQNATVNSVYNLHWDEGDKVLVSDGITSAEYTATPMDEDFRFTTLSTTSQTTPSEDADYYYAVFPSLEGTEAGPEGYKVVVPSSQTWKDNGGFDMPMVGIGLTDTLLFRNAASVIKINPNNHCDTYDGVRVTKIEVKSATQNIAGTVDVSYDGNTPMKFGEVSNGAKTITLDCSNGGAGVEFTETFYIALIPGTYDELEVTITSNGGGSDGFSQEFIKRGIGTQTFTVPAGKEYKRSQYSSVELNINNLAIYQSANCYLVKEAGTYKFPVGIKGNGNLWVNQNTHNYTINANNDTIPGLKSISEPVKVFSSEFNAVSNIKSISSFVISQKDKNAGSFNKSNTITDIKLDGSFITFNVPENFTPGNIFIGIHSAEEGSPTDGTCMWSWHIWVNDQVEDVSLGSLHSTYVPNVEILNMNMGSLQTKATLEEYAGVNSGLYYQWGRKDPFPPLASSGDRELPEPYTIDEHVVVDENSFYYGQNRASEAIVMHYPTDFITGNNASNSNVLKYEIRSWCTNAYRDHWGAEPTQLVPGTSIHNEAVKTAFDPCPPGYQIMSAFAWKSITYNWSTSTESSRNQIETYADEYMITKKGDKPVFPYDGFRTAGMESAGGHDGAGNRSAALSPCYWTSSYWDAGGMSGVVVRLYELTTGSTVASLDYIKKSNACSVRAQKQ